MYIHIISTDRNASPDRSTVSKPAGRVAICKKSICSSAFENAESPASLKLILFRRNGNKNSRLANFHFTPSPQNFKGERSFSNKKHFPTLLFRKNVLVVRTFHNANMFFIFSHDLTQFLNSGITIISIGDHADRILEFLE